MAKLRKPRYSKEEFARLGNEIYERKIRPRLAAGNTGKIAAIDIETGVFEIGEDTIETSNRLLTHHPDAQIWFVRIGHRGVHRFGPRLVTT